MLCEMKQYDAYTRPLTFNTLQNSTHYFWDIILNSSETRKEILSGIFQSKKKKLSFKLRSVKCFNEINYERNNILNTNT